MNMYKVRVKYVKKVYGLDCYELDLLRFHVNFTIHIKLDLFRTSINFTIHIK